MYKIPEDIIVTELDNNEAILLDMRNKRYYSLNETGLFILKGIESKLTDTIIIENLMSEYAVNKERARESVSTLITRLLSLNIIEKHDQ